jgi:dsRNA-specific ribonuclease
MVASSRRHSLVRRLFGELIQSTDVESWSKDAKTELQEWLQARRLPVPAYRISGHARAGACADLRGRVRRARRSA